MRTLELNQMTTIEGGRFNWECFVGGAAVGAGIIGVAYGGAILATMGAALALDYC